MSAVNQDVLDDSLSALRFDPRAGGTRSWIEGRSRTIIRMRGGTW